MLQKLELYEVQDATKLVAEFNEIVDAINKLETRVEDLMKAPKATQDKPDKKK